MKPDKTMSLDEAAHLIPAGGCSLALGGVTLYRRPMAFALALMARYTKENAPEDLTLICFTAGLESDILVAAGMVSKVRSCYFGLEGFGLAPNFTTAAGNSDIEIIEETEASLAFGIRAALAGVGFMPSTAWQGTDLPQLRPDVKTVVDPYSGETLTAFPAISIDIAVIHAIEADPDGNARIGGNWGVDRELPLVADKVVITAEKVVPRLDKADIFGPVVDAVVEVPGGAWPTSCHPLYPLDGLATLEYTEKAGTDAFLPLLKSWCRRHGITHPA
jgi:glutaconate CoA-transferase subunit A